MLPLVDISYLAEELLRRSSELQDAFEDRNGKGEADPGISIEALSELFDRLRSPEIDTPDQEPSAQYPRAELNDLGSLGHYGIDLIARLAAQAARLKLPQTERAIEELALPFACWIARHGGELGYLEPIVNGAASLANRLEHPSELMQMYALLSEVVNAVRPQASLDVAAANPSRPWRLLLLNRAIVATRSHRPELMEEAFESLVEQLPDDAPQFFREGMAQTDALNYPPHVRAIMQRYHNKWGQRMLH